LSSASCESSIPTSKSPFATAVRADLKARSAASTSEQAAAFKCREACSYSVAAIALSISSITTSGDINFDRFAAFQSTFGFGFGLRGEEDELEEEAEAILQIRPNNTPGNFRLLAKFYSSQQQSTGQFFLPSLINCITIFSSTRFEGISNQSTLVSPRPF